MYNNLFIAATPESKKSIQDEKTILLADNFLNSDDDLDPVSPVGTGRIIPNGRSFNINKSISSPMISPHARRKASTPITYKEPSLRTKVRKGHEFFVTRKSIS